MRNYRGGAAGFRIREGPAEGRTHVRAKSRKPFRTELRTRVLSNIDAKARGCVAVWLRGYANRAGRAHVRAEIRTPLRT